MRGNVISYFQMCQREGTSLQRGMNYRLHGRYSVVLMSVREGSPYDDRFDDDGETLIYEGHDVARNHTDADPKTVDQPMHLPSGSLSDNGKFYQAAMQYQSEQKPPDLVRVYEKIKKGIWTDNGFFHLADAWTTNDGKRDVFKFKLVALDDDFESDLAEDPEQDYTKHSRVIPTHVKLEVWKRDGGKCRKCGATDELHFDHTLPYSKGGTSLLASNVQLLCARHNLQKSAKIQ